ncbi:HEAT repeat domain-containing protein [Aliinostoc sp. HNIBRCY26]|uniref:HEAT repeat domain-containing protein n=1 Tax=Aliinostoc sp. HNIBRCY26 TaxID=3418997 RepID=UPI003CFCB56A
MKVIHWQVLIAHAKGEEELAEKLAEPIRKAGYEVAHRGTVMVGESFTEEASKVLNNGSPVVLCGTIKALGTRWARQIVNAARNNYRVRVFCVQMEEEADLEAVSFDESIAHYWQDPTKATQDLIASLKKHYPLEVSTDYVKGGNDAEQRYRELALESCDIIHLANLPEPDRHIATQKLLLRRLYVALRVQVEIGCNDEVDAAKFEEIEKRRIVMRFKNAARSGVEREEREDGDKRFPIGDRLAEAKRLVVLGDPGAGKTTMVRWIATAYLLRLKQDPDWRDLPDVSTLPDEDWLPIIIRCRDLDEASLSGSLDDILGYTLRKAEMSESECTALRGILRQKLHHGTALLLIDGLDEITDPRLRAKFCQQIEKICDAYKQAPIIATSRIVGYREMGYRIGRQFEHVTVAELTTEDKDDFASRWCDITELPERREKAKTDLIKDIHSAERIERLTGNPMLLTTMALVKRKVGKLPTRRHKLYAQAVDVLLNWRSEIDEPIDDDEALPQLEYIAYAMCHRGVQQLRKDEIIELLETFREEYPNLHEVKKHTPKEFLNLLERRTGILVEAGILPHNGRDISVFEFRHLTFQEYLAGLALVQGHFPNRDRNLADYVAPLAANIKGGQVTENWQEALRLCVAACNHDDVDNFLRAILNPLKDEDPLITARPRAVMAVLCLADEPNVSGEVVQEVLQEFVRQIGEEDGSTSDPQTTVDAAAIELSASQWSEKLQNSMLEEFCRRDTKTGIASQSSIGGLYAMVTVSQSQKEETIFPQWVEKQIFQLTSEQEVNAIGAALIVMELVFRDKLSVSESVLQGVIDKLLTMLRRSNPASYAAAWALFWLSGGGERKNIEDAMWQPTNTELDSIISIFKNPHLDTGAVLFLTQILGYIKYPQVVKPLIAKLDDSDENVRLAVVKALGKIGSTQAVKPLITKLDDSDEDVRLAVVEALGKIGSTQAVKPLIAKLDDSDKNLVEVIEKALCKLGHKQTINDLFERLSSDDRKIRTVTLKKLSLTCDEYIDCKLLSRDIDAFDPFLDPQKEIDEERVQYAAEVLEISVEEVRSRYQALAQKFRLKLNIK